MFFFLILRKNTNQYQKPDKYYIIVIINNADKSLPRISGETQNGFILCVSGERTSFIIDIGPLLYKIVCLFLLTNLMVASLKYVPGLDIDAFRGRGKS